MNIFLIKHNNNIFGIYNDLDLALDYIYSLVNSNLVQKSSNIIIHKYKINSGVVVKEYNVDLNYSIYNRSIINYHKTNENIFIKPNDELNKYETDSISVVSSEKSSINTEEEERRKREEREFIQKQNILAQEKINVVHNINLLKEELKKKEEKLNQYNYDLELYNKFKDLKTKNPLFVIPFMFEHKYNIFHILDCQNNLSYENYMEKYKPEKISTTYDGLFEEDYENKLSETVNSVISEVFSNANDDDLYLATNQFFTNSKDTEENIDTSTSSATILSD